MKSLNTNQKAAIEEIILGDNYIDCRTLLSVVMIFTKLLKHMTKSIIFVLLFLIQCQPREKKVQVEEVALGTNLDREIVFFNIGDGDRADIADLLLQIEKCQPLVIGVDALFIEKTEPSKDSALEHAFAVMKNDVIAYKFDSTGKVEKAVDEFRSKASGEGFIDLEWENGLANHFTPMRDINGAIYESFALKIIKLWKPSYELSVLPNKSIPIRFKRSQEDFDYFEKPNLEENDVRELLSNKIVLVGYLGPSSEDKHFTPLRSKLKTPSNEPDTYGVVIYANAIRTLLEYYAD